jgi:transposase
MGREERSIAPRAAITDKGYDSKANRDGARKRGICPVIPYKSNATDRPAFFAKILYKARARIEQAVGKLKRFKRVALRCEKTALNYGSFVALAFGFILVKSVHMAYRVAPTAGNQPNTPVTGRWVPSSSSRSRRSNSPFRLAKKRVGAKLLAGATHRSSGGGPERTEIWRSAERVHRSASAWRVSPPSHVVRLLRSPPRPDQSRCFAMSSSQDCAS